MLRKGEELFQIDFKNIWKNKFKFFKINFKNVLKNKFKILKCFEK
jgi:hypothetical protein